MHYTVCFKNEEFNLDSEVSKYILQLILLWKREMKQTLLLLAHKGINNAASTALVT